MNGQAEAMGETALAPLDIAHLERQTMGDVSLQREVLGLFAEHAARTMDLVKAAESLKERREAAHALVGAARGIGAFEVAAKAASIENDTSDSPAGLAELQSAIEAVCLRIEEHLSEQGSFRY
jgi:HPt (histidine-containing phosphotransfer) domain-containing protein